jgi:pimeloyl-ACP methyl ester carboxylesterase
MAKPILHFAHANGFPAQVYSEIFKILKSDFNLIFKDMLAHDDRFPIVSTWMKSGEEIIDFITATTSEKVIGVGHSFGATATLNAAFLRPDLFKGLILIEPVIMNGWQMVVFSKVARTLGITHHFTPAKKSKGRRNHWPDLESVRKHFKDKSLFKNFDPACFNDFIEYGFTKTEDGYKLKFSVEKELEIFNALPSHTDFLNGKLAALPGHIISGTKTNVSLPKRMKRLATQQNFEWTEVEGTHMFPLEQPKMTAELIRGIATKFI